MNLILRLLVTSLLVLLISYFMPGVSVAGFGTALIVAIVLALLNLFIKPILVLFTLPVTIVTFGLFLLVINAIVIVICDIIVGGFEVESFITAILFSLVLSLFQAVVFSFNKE